jgi:hypothetical protein
MALSRSIIHDIYSAIYSCSLDHFNSTRTFDSNTIKTNIVEHLKSRHHPDVFLGKPIDSLVNKYYEIIYGLDDAHINSHLHQTIGKGQWKRERHVTQNETFQFISDSIERETKILYQRPLKL